MLTTTKSYRFFVVLTLLFFPVHLFGQTDNGLGGQQKSGDTLADDAAIQRTSINNVINLCFGTFFPGNSGGSIQITKEGQRTATGSVIPLHSELSPAPAIFEIKCPSNTMINVVVDERIVLQNQSGATLVCQPLEQDKGSFVSPNNAEAGFLIGVGAKMEVPEASQLSAGEYSGRVHVLILFE